LRGDQLPPDHDPIDVEWLRAASGLELVEVLAEATSTMDRGREIATAVDSPLPAAVIAERQTAGRGRRGASWWQPPGSLAVSLVVDGAAWGGSPRPIWSLACGIALAETIRLLEPSVAAVVRWPNDVEVGGRKLAGILVESATGGRSVFGIGVNTTGTAAEAPEPLRQRVATLPDLTGRPLARQRLLAVLVPRLLDLLAADAAETAGRYRSLCGLTGKSVRVFVGDAIHEGTCRGVADDGGLVVATAAGEVVIHSGSLTPPGSEWRGGQG
jgi:BirA family biotin operon repressor/biotin-[acetyl-CoA-carboxylase] ligase